MADLMKSEVLAGRLGVTVATVRAWARRGWIPCMRAGKRPLLFDLEAVLEALRRRGKEPPGDEEVGR
ncbi:MAG: helix-turn-helix domain-containing protein [Planctomycetota bacterium]|nr:helix-turn-helix domain-containing protein [Planctomycetota bacterium]